MREEKLFEFDKEKEKVNESEDEIDDIDREIKEEKER